MLLPMRCVLEARGRAGSRRETGSVLPLGAEIYLSYMACMASILWLMALGPPACLLFGSFRFWENMPSEESSRLIRRTVCILLCSPCTARGLIPHEAFELDLTTIICPKLSLSLDSHRPVCRLSMRLLQPLSLPFQVHRNIWRCVLA